MDEAKLAGGIFVVSLVILFVVGVYLFNWIDRMKEDRASDRLRERHAPGNLTRIKGRA